MRTVTRLTMQASPGSTATSERRGRVHLRQWRTGRGPRRFEQLIKGGVSPGHGDQTRVGIVPHTHWDREWYAPFQVFRARLVRLLDELLPLLERDLSYARFLLDGQTVVVDDYLEVRPEAAETLQRLAATGRLSVGPWMVLMDEFMVSGETIVRDLQLGLRARDRPRRRDAGGLPARHVRPHRADAADPAARRVRARGGVARRAVHRHADRVHVGSARRLVGARRVSLRLVLERPGSPRRRQAARRPGPELRARARAGAPSRRSDAAHERHRPPDAAAVARTGGGRGERDPGRLPVRRHVTARIRRRAADRGTGHGAGRAAVGRPRQRAHGRGVEPGGRAPGVRGGRAGARAEGGASVGAARPGRPVPRCAPRDRVAEARAEQRPRLVVRVQRRRGRRPGDGALPGGAPDRRRARAKRCGSSPPRSTRRPGRPSSSTRRRRAAAGCSPCAFRGKGRSTS